MMMITLKLTAGMLCVWCIADVPKLDFRRNRVRPFHTLRELITCISTKFRENILIGGIDMPPKRNSNLALRRRNSISGSNFDKCHFSGTCLCVIVQNFKKIAQRAGEL